MNTVDNFLVSILSKSPTDVEKIVPRRDYMVLKSLANGIKSSSFITENQSKLLLKILVDNQKKLSIFDESINTVLSNVQWSKQFRTIEQVRKLYITSRADHELALAVEFTFSSQVRKILDSLTKTVEGLTKHTNGKIYFASLTERNIVSLVDALTPLNFKIDETVKNHYDTIKTWSETEVRNQFLITTMTNQNFQKQITNDLGISTAIDQNIINDRSRRYHYFVEKPEKSPENLTEIIANRQQSKIWIDNKKYKLSEVVQSLIQLRRLPILFVFDNYNAPNVIENFKKMADALDENRIFSNIGIYFRLPNDPNGKIFNESIAERQYNSRLDDTTKIAGVQSGKIPKFFLTNSWKPMSVISLGTNLRHSKTAVYSNISDLVITYSDTQPLLETRFTWE